MQYTVKYRNADGLIDYTVVEAASRAAVFPLLEKRGISAISVTEGVHRNARPSGSPKRPMLVRGILAGVCVVALALGAWWWLASREEVRPPAEKSTKPRAVKSQPAQPRKPSAPVVQPKPKEEPLPKDKRRDIRGNIINVPKNPWGQPIPPELEYKPIWEYTTEDYAKIDPGYLARHEAHKERQAAIPWQTDADRQLAILLVSKDGNMGLLPPFNWRFKDQFLKSIETPIIVSKDDPPELQEQKRQMIEAKVYLKERMDAGEDIVDILNDEYKNAQKIRSLRQNLQEELRKLEKTATSVQEVQDYIDAANKMLDEHGAKHVGLPLVLTRLRLQREAAAGNNGTGNNSQK